MRRRFHARVRWTRDVALSLLLLLAPSAPALAQDGIDLARAREIFAEAERMAAADGGALWGVPVAGPLLLAERASRQVVADRPDAEGRLTERDGVWVGTLPPEQNVANTAVEWAGVRWTMVAWPLPENPYDRARLVAHEMFHRIQPELGLASHEGDASHLDSRDGRIWLRLEWRALAEALIREGEDRRAALADALAFRAYRHALFPDGAAAERALELNEGLAEYTGFRLSGLPERVQADRAAVQLESYDGRTAFVRSFAYASGPAYGVLLDEAGADWRAGLGPDSDLGDVAAAAYAIVLERPRRAPGAYEPPVQVAHRVERYGGVRVIEVETRRAALREQRLAAYRARLVDGPTLVLPVAEQFRYSFDPGAVEALDGVGTVYPAARVTDAWGVLTVESGGVLMVREGAAIARVVVPAPAGPGRDGVAAGDGWRLELAEGWRLERAGSGWVVARASP